MRIEAVETLLIDRYLFVEITTEDGTVGLGEGGAWGFHEATAGAIVRFKEYLLGEGPAPDRTSPGSTCTAGRIFAAAAVMAAISAIDIALWDIMGKRFEAPVHQLLGGKVRDRARCYFHVFGETKDELYTGIKEAKDAGFTAVGHLTPFLGLSSRRTILPVTCKSDWRCHRHG